MITLKKISERTYVVLKFLMRLHF